MTLKASRPPEGGLVVDVGDYWPLTDVDLEVRVPGLRFFEGLGRARTDRAGRARFGDPPGGALDRLLLNRPKNAGSPLTVTVSAGENMSSFVKIRRRFTATATFAPPPPPVIAVVPNPVGPDGAATVTVTSAEPGGTYELVARWRCEIGTTDEATLGTELQPAGPGTLQASVSLRSTAALRFDPDCAGAAPAATLPVTVELRRSGRQRGAAAAADVSLSPVG